MQLIYAILALLPTDPFAEFLDNFADIPYISYLNWFIPFYTFVPIIDAWGIAVLLHRLYNILSASINGKNGD